MRKPIAWTIAVLGLVAVLVIGLVVAVQLFSSRATPTPTAECTVPLATTTASTSVSVDPTAPVPVYLTAVQLQHASTINAVGMSRGLPQRARIIAIATAFQESGLRNLPGGDADSVGLFQQRPSQGWGSVQQIMDPVYAAGQFYDALLKVRGWQNMSLTKAAQAVQSSAFPDAYAKWEGQAVTLADALGGAAPMELSCIAGAQAPTADAPARKALAGTAAGTPGMITALSAAQAELGGLKVAAITGSTAVLTVVVPGIGVDQSGRALAAWAVAHGTGMAVTAVTVDDQSWTDHRWGRAGTQLAPGRVAITVG